PRANSASSAAREAASARDPPSAGSLRSATARRACTWTRGSGSVRATSRSSRTEPFAWARAHTPCIRPRTPSLRPRSASRRGTVAHHRPPPLAEEQVAVVFGREARLQVTEPAGRRAQPQVGQGRQRFVGALVVQVRVAVVRAEEAVADADFVFAAVVLVVADE